MSRTHRTVLVAALAAVLLAPLSGCGGGTSDLKRELEEKKKRPGSRIEPLPEIKPYESFVYDPNGLRSPFQPSVPVVAPGAGGVRPDAHRNREFLEGFSLDTLRMVGTLHQGGRTYGLVQTKDGLIHKVLPGNYVGQNDGRVTTIGDSKITVVEIVPDGMGGYMERPAAIALAATN
ncbi:MAG: pilus assembly protein PilP [Proteobacteria bacterium]|nr:pilus assembly protein PilP [Pseudomonadota bacterium]